MALPTILQNKYVINTTSQSTITLTPNSALTPGSFLWVCAWGEATMATASISDGTNTYGARGDEGYDVSWGRHWTAPNSSSGSPTITVTPAANRIMCMTLVEFGNPHLTTPYEQTGDAWGLMSVGNFPASPINLPNTTISDQLVFGSGATQPARARNLGANTGWTELMADDVGSGSSLAVIYQDASAAGAHDPDFSMDTALSAAAYTFFGISIVGGAGTGAKRLTVLGAG